MFRKFLLLALLIFPFAVNAHTPSSSYLFINEDAAELQLRWDIALRDLEFVIGLDSNQDQKISWQEVKDKQQEITAYAYSNLSLNRDNKSCQLETINLQVVEHTDGSYAVLKVQPECKASSGLMSVDYSLLFDVDANHRGIILDQRQENTNSYIASPDKQNIKISEGKDQKTGFNNFTTFVTQGNWHILIGFDHILFIVTLMLPAVLLYRRKQWIAVDEFRPAIISLLKIVTAFTIAHSITLSLAILEVVSLPSRWVESAIALSVILVAVNNIKPLFIHSRWSMAFLFGLIHGFGFASVLNNLELNSGSLLLSLLGFNVGVEIGQGLTLLLLFPLAYLLRKSNLYQTYILKFGSLLISLLASVWLVQRIAV